MPAGAWEIIFTPSVEPCPGCSGGGKIPADCGEATCPDCGGRGIDAGTTAPTDDGPGQIGGEP